MMGLYEDLRSKAKKKKQPGNPRKPGYALTYNQTEEGIRAEADQREYEDLLSELEIKTGDCPPATGSRVLRVEDRRKYKHALEELRAYRQAQKEENERLWEEAQARRAREQEEQRAEREARWERENRERLRRRAERLRLEYIGTTKDPLSDAEDIYPAHVLYRDPDDPRKVLHECGIRVAPAPGR